MTVPVWLLDIDGVLNAAAKKPDRNVWPAADWIEGRAHEAGGAAWRILAARPVVDFIRGVHEEGRAEIRWHTTWQHDAAAVAKLRTERLGATSPVRASDPAGRCPRRAGQARSDGVSMAESVTAADPLDLDYHGDVFDLITASGLQVSLRRQGQRVYLAYGHPDLPGWPAVVLTDDEADRLAYNLACASLAAMACEDDTAAPVEDVSHVAK